MRYFILLMCIFPFINQSYSQEKNKINELYGFSFSGITGKFLAKEPGFSSTESTGYRTGLFYIKKLSSKFNAGLELQVGRESHKINFSGSDYRIRETTIALPLNLYYELFKMPIYLSVGGEYLYSKKKGEFKLQQSNFNGMFGLSYKLSIDKVTLMPEIRYLTGLNNSIIPIIYDTNQIKLYKSAFMFSLKIM